MMETPQFSCPHIARLELWLQDKLTKEEFKELESRMDEIRAINLGLREYARFWKGTFREEDSRLFWTEYSWENRDSHPPKSGRYLIYREGCDKMHFEQWNGSGWASSNNDCTHWSVPNTPDK